MKGGKKTSYFIIIIKLQLSKQQKKPNVVSKYLQKKDRENRAQTISHPRRHSPLIWFFKRKSLGEKSCKKFIRNIFNLQMGLHIAPLVQAIRVVSCAKTVPTTFSFRTVQREAPKTSTTSQHFVPRQPP